MLTRVVLAMCAVVACDPECPDPVVIWNELVLPDSERRLEAAVAARGAELVIAGGYETSLAEGLAITNEVLVFNTLTDEFQTLPPAPVAWTHAQLAAHGGRTFLLGGHEDVNGTASGRAFVLEAQADAWRELPPMPVARGAAAVLVSPPFIYLFGGADRAAIFDDVIAFDMIDESWIENALPDLPTPRSHTAVMERFDGMVVLTGGIAEQGPLGDTYRLLPGDGVRVWSIAEPMGTLRGGCVYGSAFGSLLCAGGEGGTTALDVVERYDPLANAWTELPPMPEPRAGVQGAMIGGKLYVVGGSRTFDFEPTGSIFVFSFVNTIDEPR